MALLFVINAAASALQPPGDFPYDKDGGPTR
jgi:hypothetical protein